MIDIDTRDRTEQRKFGWVMAGAFAVLAGVRTLIHRGLEGHWPESPPWVLLGIAAVFLALAFAAPAALRPAMVAWFALARLLNVVVTWLVLTVVFITMLVPGRLILILLRKDVLHRRPDPSAASYWVDADEAPSDPKRYYDQF